MIEKANIIKSANCNYQKVVPMGLIGYLYICFYQKTVPMGLLVKSHRDELLVEKINNKMQTKSRRDDLLVNNK